MKKYISILILIVMALSITACQATPDEVVVVQKDTDRLIEQAQDENSSIGVDELEIPERYECTVQQEGDKLKIIADADVHIPMEKDIPAVRVQAGNFSQDLVDKLYDKLIGDIVMYEFSTEKSKVMLKQEILQAEKQLANAKGEQEIEEANAILNSLWAEYKMAPEEVVWKQANSTLQSRRMENEESNILNGDQKWLNIMENNAGGRTFSVFNNTEYDNIGTGESYSVEDEQGNEFVAIPSRGATLDYNRCGYANSLIENNGGYIRVEATAQSLSGGTVEDSILTITAKEARTMAEAFLTEVGITNMIVEKVSLVSNVNVGENVKNEKQDWQITLLRTVNGVEVVSDFDQTLATDDTYSASWSNEKFYITVDDEGIRDIHWVSPLDVTEIVEESSAMLPFGKIQSIFENMMRIQYEPQAREFEQNTEYHIIRVRLSLQRISEKDSFTTGLLIPVWNFYGYESFPGSEQPVENPWPLMTINGIDGSIIDPIKGY